MVQTTNNESTLQQFQLLQETQAQIEILNTQITKINQRIATLQLNQKRSEAALEAIDNTRSGQRVYKQVARVLILREPGELREEIDQEKTNAEENLPKLNTVKAQLVAKLGGLNAQFVDINTQLRHSLLSQNQ
ncbi:Prefoldin subunit family protein [Babesia bovis T2Bo]|uniref:Prefoldin subunit family protein n=1 Tax=Babesia bovis T2Bo TaxID=484906 RepID=UPI001DAAD49F|nr:Prefoldin subunit family protein [Babesia bovis T2Bo]KAG6439967.1 Prefoldin subunit family protein [Babesia bovis T2Bo]